MNAKPKLAVFKFASCDGCQVSVLNLDEELLALAERVDVAFFLEATSRVVGKVLTADDHRRLIDDAVRELDFSALERRQG